MNQKKKIKLKYLFIFSMIIVFFVQCKVSSNISSNQNTHIDNLRKKLTNSDGNDIMVIAHRGDWRYALENSILAIENAAAMGVDIVEIDVRLTKDSIPVLMHDNTIDRTTTGTGKMEDWTYNNLQTLFLRNGYGVPTEQKVITLKEAMLAAKGKVLINLDKCYTIFDKVYEVLEATGTINHALMKGEASYSEFISKYPNHHKGIYYMPVVDLSNKNFKKLISNENDLKPIAYEFIFKKDTVNIIKEIPKLRENGSRVWVNSLWASLCGGHHDEYAVLKKDKKNTYGWLIKNGFNMIQTDRPQLLLDYLRSEKLHE